MTEKDYPYTGKKSKTCLFDRRKPLVKVQRSIELPTEEKLLKKWIGNNGPVSIVMNAQAMFFYLGGIAKPWDLVSNQNDLNHAALIVGYGTKIKCIQIPD